jgi:hypothetical protein
LGGEVELPRASWWTGSRRTASGRRGGVRRSRRPRPGGGRAGTAGTISATSFAAFLHAYHDGDIRTVDGDSVLDALARFSTEPVTPDSCWIRTTDGEAQIFGLDGTASGFMINHASGRVIWDALGHVADVTGMAILPIGCPTCVTRPELLALFAEGLKTDTRLVTTGEQLVAAFN